MRITDLLNANGIQLHAAPAGRDDAIDLLVSLQDRAGRLTGREQYKADILAREALSSTAIGNGIAVPHAKSAAVREAGLAAITVPAGVDYEAPDGLPSKLFFMIAAPQAGGDVHLEMLSRLMVMLMDEEFCRKLLEAEDTETFLSLIDAQERAKYPDEPAPAVAEEDAGRLRVLAITACPTGIAHTYMAAEALEKKGRELNIGVKAETQGSGGAKNILTREEIAGCDGIIIAADKNVDLARFDGKPLLRVPVSDGINRPEELIRKIVDGQAPVYHHQGAAAEEDLGNESTGRRLYKHLMNGVSHMLPFVIGGGIIMALSFLLDSGAAGTAAFGSSWALPAFFNKAGNLAFSFMVPILSAFIAQSIADRPGLMVGFVGGSLAASGATFAYFADPTVPIVPAGFLGGLLAGFVGGWFMKWLRKICDKLPASLEGLKPILIYPVVGLLFIGAFMCVVNPFVGMLNNALTNGLNSMGGSSAVLLGALVAGMQATDGRPHQQGGLCLRHRLHRHGGGRLLPGDGRRHGRRHGAPHRHRPGHHLLQGPFHRRRAQVRPGELHHGTVLHHRGRHPLRRLRPPPRAALLHRGLRRGGRAVHGLRLRLPGAPRRTVRLPGDPKSPGLRRRRPHRSRGGNVPAGAAEKEKRVIKLLQTGKAGF